MHRSFVALTAQARLALPQDDSWKFDHGGGIVGKQT
jgi:hypothetical protein